MFKNIIKITTLITITNSLVFAQCTNEQKEDMIKLNLSQKIIDRSCNDIEINQNNNIDNESFKSNYKNDYNSLYFGFGIGSGSGSQNMKMDNYYYTGSYETNYDSKTTTFKIGHIFPSKNRFELSFNKINASAINGEYFLLNETDYENSTYTGFDLDWLLTLSTNKYIQPYLMIGFGFYSNDDIHGYRYDTGEEDITRALALNGGIGFNYIISNIVDLEVAYKIKSMSWNIEEPDIDDRVNSLYVGMNLKF